MEEEINATEGARRLAEELDVDLTKLSQRASFRPPGGRQITEKDVELADKTRNVKSIFDLDIGVLQELVPSESPGRAARGADEEPEVEESSRESASKSRRLNVVFSEPAYNTLKEMAEQSGKSISEVVRDAIALQKWFTDTRRGGGRILVEERGRVREIMSVR